MRELSAGRPESDEDWRTTRDREVMEEACARVMSASLLGFVRGVCLKGSEEGLVLVRAIWRADVELLPWDPQHEMRDRLLIEPSEALAQMTIPAGLAPLYCRLIEEALSLTPDFSHGDT